MSPTSTATQRYPEHSGWIRRRRALVAAEDEQARRFLSEALARAGYLSDVVDRAPTLGDLAAHSILILQLEAGVDVARDFRLRGTTIPILLLCGGPESPDEPSTIDLGPLERLRTPFTVPSLLAALSRLVPGL